MWLCCAAVVDFGGAHSWQGSLYPLQARMCTKAELATLLSNASSKAGQSYANICAYLRGDGGASMAAEVSTCSLQASLPAFPAVKTFGKPAKPPHTGLRMPPVNEQLQISANHFANAMLVLWALLPSDDLAADGISSHDTLVWGTHLLTKQVCHVVTAHVMYILSAAIRGFILNC